jgi:zinc transport system ATP-binding protein
MTAPLLEARDLVLTRDGRLVLDRVSLAVAAGEIVTLVGPNGSGKTSLVRCLIGALKPDAGRIQRKPGLWIGYVPQKLAFERAIPMSVGRYLSLAGGTASERTALLARVGLPGAEDRQIADLSGGQHQRALLAAALIGKPDILVLDEAAQGLDQPAEAAFYRLIEEVRNEMGCAILMVSHDLHVVMSASDRVICLNGHVCCEGTPTIVSNAPEYRRLFGYGTEGALALYRHEHDHSHDHDHGHDHGDGHAHAHHHPQHGGDHA